MLHGLSAAAKGVRHQVRRRDSGMGSTHASEIVVRAVMKERERELQRINQLAWQEPTRPSAWRRGAARRAVGGWVMRVVKWIACAPAETTRDGRLKDWQAESSTCAEC